MLVATAARPCKWRGGGGLQKCFALGHTVAKATWGREKCHKEADGKYLRLAGQTQRDSLTKLGAVVRNAQLGAPDSSLRANCTQAQGLPTQVKSAGWLGVESAKKTAVIPSFIKLEIQPPLLATLFQASWPSALTGE